MFDEDSRPPKHKGDLLRRLTEDRPQSLKGRLLRLPLQLIPTSATLTVKGGINKGARWIVGSSLHSCWIGTFEAAKQDLLRRVVRPGMIAWDVGANAGFYTLALSRIVGSDGHVFAFEPFAENVHNILRHVHMNHVSNATVVQAALGREYGMVGFRIGSQNSMGFVSNDERSYLVPSLTADEFIDEHPHARPDLLKIDVEGAESDLLVGAERLLRDSCPDIILALHGPEQTTKCVDRLSSLGYTFSYLDGMPVTGLPLRSDEIYACKGASRAGS